MEPPPEEPPGAQQIKEKVEEGDLPDSPEMVEGEGAMSGGKSREKVSGRTDGAAGADEEEAGSGEESDGESTEEETVPSPAVRMNRENPEADPSG